MMSEHQVVIIKEAQNIRDLVGKGDEDGKGKDKAKHPFVIS